MNLLDWVENPTGSWFVITSRWYFVGIEGATEQNGICSIKNKTKQQNVIILHSTFILLCHSYYNEHSLLSVPRNTWPMARLNLQSFSSCFLFPRWRDNSFERPLRLLSFSATSRLSRCLSSATFQLQRLCFVRALHPSWRCTLKPPRHRSRTPAGNWPSLWRGNKSSPWVQS